MTQLTTELSEIKKAIKPRRARDFLFGEVFVACDVAEIICLGNSTFSRNGQVFNAHPFQTLPVLKASINCVDENDSQIMLDEIVSLEEKIRLLEDKLKEAEARQELLENYIVSRRKRTPKQKAQAKKEMAIFLNDTFV